MASADQDIEDNLTKGIECLGLGLRVGIYRLKVGAEGFGFRFLGLHPSLIGLTLKKQNLLFSNQSCLQALNLFNLNRVVGEFI